MNLSFTVNEIAKLLTGKTVCDEDIAVNQIFIDSRQTGFSQNAAFFALKGPNHDGHRFIPELIKKGIRIFIVTHIPEHRADAVFIKVPDTLLALQKTAAAHRSLFKYPVLGITGSNGKTVVKEWVSKLTAYEIPVAKSPKSYNSQVGVPLSLFEIEPEHRAAVIEAGISKPGEMEHLQKMIRPQYGIFTTIGEAHDEHFESRSRKISEKCRLFASCKKIIYNTAEHDVEQALQKYFGQNRLLGCSLSSDDEADCRAVRVSKKNESTEMTVRYFGSEYTFTVPFTENIFLMNALQSFAAGCLLGSDPKKTAERMHTLPGLAMRLEMKRGLGNSTLINDAYSNDLHSLGIALRFLKRQSGDSDKTVILSDLIESGRKPEQWVRQINVMLKNAGVSGFIGVGPEMCRYGDEIELADKKFYGTTEELLGELYNLDFSGRYILLKGARAFRFERVDVALQAQTHHTLLHVDMEALTHNLNEFRKAAGRDTRLMVMIKAAAYGSGIVETAGLLQFHRVDYLGVAYADEGIELRNAGIALPVMVMSPEQSRFDALIRHRLEPELYNEMSFRAFVKALEHYPNAKRPYPVHLKIDTGMHRLGFEESDFEVLADLIRRHPQVKIASVFSHLAAGDDPDEDAFTREQIRRFEDFADRLEQVTDCKPLRHIANTAGMTRFPDKQLDMVRLGLGLYGITGDANMKRKLRPAMRLTSRIVQIKEVPAGESIGYGRREVCDRDTRIATVSIGYADGLNRLLSNRKGKLFVKGRPAEIAGNVCMDMCMIDITDIKDVKEGDEVEVFGENQTVEELAAQLNTIPYEILTGISERVKRVYTE